MEDEKKIVMVYSNNSKKARLKRNKNKFQRIWDAEKQTYIKVRKAKFPVNPSKVRKDWKSIDDSAAIARRSNTPKKTKSVPVNAVKASNKPETVQKVHKEPARVHGKITTTSKAKLYKISGVNYTWDSNAFRYKKVA